MSESGQISAHLGTERKSKLKSLADQAFHGNLTAALVAAVDSLLEEDVKKRESALPMGIRESVEFLHLLTAEGSMRDWEVVVEEVDRLWQSLQSSSS